jgi:nitrite reductase (NADH) small subunit/3-phenylpropionate/trans-cinnamate dioxygenase ferredoxin subunit
MTEFVKIGEVRQFRKGRGRVVTVDGVQVAVFWTGDRFIGIRDACSHMGASLADGTLEGDTVVCSWHGWRYDVKTGRCTTKSWACAPVYEIRVEGESVLARRREARDPPPIPS